MAHVHTEVLLVAGYASFLLVAAAGLDRLARHAKDRSELFRTGTFTHPTTHDHWVCPENQIPWPHSFDEDARVVRHRAEPHTCPAEHRRTTSRLKREVVRPLDPWPHSEAARFHRVIALVLVALSGVVIVAEAVRHHTPAELAVLGVVTAAAVATGWWLIGNLRSTPSNFPEPTAAHGPRLVSSRTGKRTRWGAGHRSTPRA